MRPSVAAIVLTLVSVQVAQACDLCAVYNADTAMGDSGAGFSLTISEQFIPYRTTQLDGDEVSSATLDDIFLDRSITHIVPTWNFSERFGVSVNLPIIYQRYEHSQIIPTAPFIVTDSDSEVGIGDLSLIGRVTAFRTQSAEATFSVNLLGGVKFPTGDTEHLEDEVALTRLWEPIAGTGHSHAVGGVHLRDLTFGSGSYDGIFGVTVNARWLRLYGNAQFQYYLRTKGESGYEFGDQWMLSGGPGFFVFLEKSFTLGVQALATYDTMDADEFSGERRPNTGMTAIYLGPQLILTIGQRFNANAGVDVPIEIDNKGLQNVPDYRFHGGVSFRF
jgi:hypothetical protein